MPSGKMPSFERPPVNETVIGVEFAPIDRWGVPHFGLFWGHIQDQFPQFSVQPPLVSQIERFDSPEPTQSGMQIDLANPLDPRCWFISADDADLLQVQSTRFLSNWRKRSDAAVYPRYEQYTRPQFERHWTGFREFVERQGLPSPEVLQCEVSYVNHIPRGEGWSDPSDVSSVFRIQAPTPQMEFLPASEGLAFRTNFLMPDHSGRLRVTLGRAVRNIDAVEVLVFTLTARGKPRSSATEDILAWCDQGREWIVRGFTDLTTRKMHEIWKRTT